MANSNSRNGGCGGIGIGSLLAIILSWDLNHSFVWAFIHMLFGWFYVIYHLIIHGWTL